MGRTGCGCGLLARHGPSHAVLSARSALSAGLTAFRAAKANHAQTARWLSRQAGARSARHHGHEAMIWPSFRAQLLLRFDAFGVLGASSGARGCSRALSPTASLLGSTVLHAVQQRGAGSRTGPSPARSGCRYWLCYAFCRCTRSVSYCPPAYYAHLVADRGRILLDRDAISEDFRRSGAPSVSGKSGGSSGSAGIKLFAPHVEIRDRMFFC